MPRRARWGVVWCVLGLTIGAGAGIIRATAASAPRSEVGLRVGQSPPPFSASDLSGSAQTLDRYRGRVLVLHFWATWCPYCRTEIPNLSRLHEELGGQGVSVLAVSVDEDRQALEQFLTRNTLPYPIIADVESSAPISNDYAVSGLPTTYVIGRDGRIVSRWSGAGGLLNAVGRALEQG